MENSKIKIFTDGAARGNPGPAGWGVVFILDDKIFEIGGRQDIATNNQMELSACIHAMKYLKSDNFDGEIEFFCDSKYVIKGITEWIFNWLKNDWRNAANKPVLNKYLWLELHGLVQEALSLKGKKISWTYVERHAGVTYNERADQIATSFADDKPVPLFKK